VLSWLNVQFTYILLLLVNFERVAVFIEHMAVFRGEFMCSSLPPVFARNVWNNMEKNILSLFSLFYNQMSAYGIMSGCLGLTQTPITI